MSPPVAIRPARATDAADLAILEDMASRGLTAHIWCHAKVESGVMTAHEFGRARALDPAVGTNFRNALIAEADGMAAGASISYPIVRERVDMNRLPDIMKPIMELRALLDDVWYIDTLAVYHHNRGAGIGRALLEAEFARGTKAGKARTALTVEDANEPALRLYRGMGFEPVDRRGYTPIQDGSPARKFWLMDRKL